MATECTFLVIKRDAAGKLVTGGIIGRFEVGGFWICAMKRIHMSKRQAGVSTRRTASVRSLVS